MDREVWEKHSNFIDECLMVLGGHDIDGTPVYIGRSKYGDNILPAKVILKNCTAIITVSFEGQAHSVQNCEILVNTGFRWKHFLNSDPIPNNAVQAGILEDGTKQFIGRAFFQGALTPGRVSAESKILFLPYLREEVIRVTSFEILVVDDEGIDYIETPRTSVPRTSLTLTPSTSSIAPTSTCSICIEENIKILGIFMECGHACLCEGCISKVNAQRNANGKVNCPICRKESAAAKKIFFI